MPCLEPFEPDAARLQVIEADPAIEEHSDVLYMPFAGYGTDDDPSWGIYDRDNRLIQAGAYCRGPDRVPVGQSERLGVDVGRVEAAPEEHYIYAGPLSLHYGHFLLSTLSRFWPFRGSPPAAPLLWHGHYDPVVLPNFPFVGQLLATLGIAAPALHRFTRPTRIKRLTVIAPAFEEEHRGHRAFRHLCRAIGGRLAGDADGPPQAPAYLARSRLTWGVKAIANEAPLCQALAALGVEVIHPEQLGLPDQVRLFGSDRVIMGLSGSAFHTAIFARPRPRLLAIEIGNGVNQLLVNRLSGSPMVSLRPVDPLPSAAGHDGIGRVYTLPDPVGVARDLLRHAQGWQR